MIWMVGSIWTFTVNSVHQVGYQNKAIIDGLKEQLDDLAFIPRRYTNDIAIEAASMLLEKSYGELGKVLFTPSGSSSIELALKIVRYTTGKFKTVSFWDSFHGAGLGAISIGGEKMFRSEIGPLVPGNNHIMPYNSYRCIFGDCEVCGIKCLDYLEYVFDREGDIGALILEPIRATDVQIPTREYFKKIKELCNQYNVKIIFDEIPTAFGRTGEFYSYQNFNITPDILVLGKGIGGGIVPISAVLTKEVLNSVNHISLGHYTHEKSALGSRAIVETIKYIDENKLIEHVKELEVFISSELSLMKNEFECIGDIRVKGVLFAIELVLDRKLKTKAADESEKILYSCLDKGLSFKISQSNVLTMGPPITITKEQLMESFDILSDSIRDVFYGR